MKALNNQRTVNLIGRGGNPANGVLQTVGMVGVPNLIGMTSAQATAAILARGLVVGTITGASGNVTVQSPLAGLIALRGSAVNYTIV